MLTPREQVLLAIQVATRAHKGQKRKDGTDYISHPVTVAFMAVEDGASELVVAACLLHDVVEDTDVTLEQLRELGFWSAVVDGVDAVTKRPGESYLADFIPRCKADPVGKPVKEYDIKHNLKDQSALDPDEAAFLKERYTKAREVLNG